MWEEVEGYETVESDWESDSTSSVVSVVFPAGGDSGRKGKEREESDDGSRFLRETMSDG